MKLSGHHVDLHLIQNVIMVLSLLFFQTKEFSEEDLKLINEDHVRSREQLLLCSQECGQYSFRLPPSSPYDKFLKAAGC